MARVTTGLVVRQIESLFDGSSITGLSDRQLIERFTDRFDAQAEAAFSALVNRHGPMVLRICRQTLGDRHHAEDAFQAVFLVLARRARSVRNPDLVANWLYDVALRTARKARMRLALQRVNEQDDGAGRRDDGVASGVVADVPAADEVAMAREHAEALYREIDQLPAPFRLPVTLCYFEGLTLDEAVGRLRWPAGTVRSRLARAREKLRRGLSRRGIVLPAGAMALGFAGETATASGSVGIPLCASTTRAAIDFVGGGTSRAAVAAFSEILAREVLRSMFMKQAAFVACAVLLLTALGGGAGLLAQTSSLRDQPESQSAVQRAKVVSKVEPQVKAPGVGRKFVVGRVLDPEGKAVPGATVMVYSTKKLRGRVIGAEMMGPTPMSHSASDRSGRFHVEARRTSSASDHYVGAVAMATGYGVGWVVFDVDADQPTADITLRPEQVIQGRLFDVQGRAVAGVRVRLVSLGFHRGRAGAPLDRPDGPFFSGAEEGDLAGWPKSAISDNEGRFVIRGAGQGLQVTLAVNDPRFATQRIVMNTEDHVKLKELKAALQPAQIVTGRVSYADTGKPVAHTWLGGGFRRFQTDADGRYRANPFAAERYSVIAFAPDGEPYLCTTKEIEWPKGAVEQIVDIALARGVLVRGKVIEEGSGKPVAGAALRYHVNGVLPGGNETRSSPAETAADGSFAVPLAPGTLTVGGPSDDYVCREIGLPQLLNGGSAGVRVYVNEFVACDPKLKGGDLNFDFVLRRGAVIKGKVIGPDELPISEAWKYSRLILGSSTTGWRAWSGRDHGATLGDRFELHGLAADSEVPVTFLEAKRKLGATVQLSGKLAGSEPVTV